MELDGCVHWRMMCSLDEKALRRDVIEPAL